jgi:hypothetical protein
VIRVELQGLPLTHTGLLRSAFGQHLVCDARTRAHPAVAEGAAGT